jgi:hypothetical protein
VSLSLAARQARLSAVGALIDANGGGAAHFYALPMPAKAEDAPMNAPLAIVALATPCGTVGATPQGLATFSLTPAAGQAAASGVVGWVRFVDGVGAAIDDQPVGPPGSGAPVLVTDNKPNPSAQLYAGGEVQLVAGVLTE